MGTDSEQNGSKHSPGLIWSYFLHVCTFDLFMSFSYI